MSTDDIEPVYNIHDNKGAKCGITGKWLTGDKLSVTAFRPIISSSKDVPTEYKTMDPTKIYHLRSEFIFEDSILRSLISEANNIFSTVQEMKQEGSRSDYLKISRAYRSTIRACLEKLQAAITDSDSDGLAQYENYITIFYSIECVWHLCEILIIDPIPSNMVIPQLLEWIRFHFPETERRAGEFLMSGREADLSDFDIYWFVVRGQILQGQTEVARALLKLHSSSESVSFQMAEQILKTIPIYNVYGSLPLQKFRSQWQYWVTDTESKIATGILATEPELEKIIKLVTGNGNAWNEQAKLSTCWYEYLPGFLFYTEPGCKYFELGTFANVWLTRWANVKGQRSASNLKHLDKVILSVMENDMHQVLHDIQHMGDNQWFVTHLTDLLFNCGQLQILGEQQNNVTALLRESLLFDFGSTLMSRDSLWLDGLDYLEYSSSEGIAAMELLLSKVPITNEKQAQKIINVARTKGLAAIERDVCRILATRSLANKRFGNALEWAIRSQDNIFVTSVADIFLNNYCKNGEMMCPDILSNIGAKMFISPRLVFLVKYFDFHQYYKRKEFSQAAELLVNLLDSKITPEYFWPSLLTDTIPLLESSEPIIPSKETTIIIHHLESQFIPLIQKEKEKLSRGEKTTPKLLSDYRIENIEELIKLIRLASARNLTRTLIIENTVAF